MRSVLVLEKSFREYDISFLRKIVSRINVLKISHSNLNEYIVDLDVGTITVKKQLAVSKLPQMEQAELEFNNLTETEIPTTDFHEQINETNPVEMLNKVIKEAVDFVLKNNRS
jgi:hypothetical protein